MREMTSSASRNIPISYPLESTLMMSSALKLAGTNTRLPRLRFIFSVRFIVVSLAEHMPSK